MQDIQDLLVKAEALGEALAAHATVKDYHTAQHAARTNTEAQQLLRDYQTQAAHIHQLELEQKPIEVADKQKLRQYETGMASNEALKNLMRTQTEYVALMNQVNQTMDAPLAVLAHPEQSA